MKTQLRYFSRLRIAAILFIAGLSILLSSCASTSRISMEVLVPAQINLPKHVKKVAVINRSLPAKGEGFSNFLEGFLSGESIRGDREASDHCVKGLVDKLNNSPRIGAVLVSYPQLKGTGTRDWPIPIDWSMVDSLCKMYKSDALVALETFDSDILFNTGKNLVKQTINNKDTLITEFFSDLKINVNAGWRLYDNINRKIIDQNSFMDEKAWFTKGYTPDEALKKLPDKRDAINMSGVFAGSQFGMRISPTWVHAFRSYYVKGKKENGFKMAKKWVKQKNWEQAKNIWTNISKSSNLKNAGRALYNLAVASEMDGNLEQALTYAKKSNEIYNSWAARNYINVLNIRIMDQDKLKEQMGN